MLKHDGWKAMPGLPKFMRSKLGWFVEPLADMTSIPSIIAISSGGQPAIHAIGRPPPTFTMSFASSGMDYTVQFTHPNVLSSTSNFEIVQSPGNSLRSVDALLGMVGRANAFDRVLVEQLYEHKYWGLVNTAPITDPNPRPEAYIVAARRGATVYLLLDSAYNDPTDPRGGNTAMCDYLNGIAIAAYLNLACRLGNPAGTGIHNKMVPVSSVADALVLLVASMVARTYRN